MPNHVFPQTGDNDDAENFGQMIGHTNITDYVGRGFEFTPDYTIPEVSVTEGVAYIKSSSEQTTSTSETRLDVGYVVQLPSTTLSLTGSTTNYIYVTPNVGSDDSASFTVYTDSSNATEDELKIGRIDTSSNTSNEINRGPKGNFRGINIGQEGETGQFSNIFTNIVVETGSTYERYLWNNTESKIGNDVILPSDYSGTGLTGDGNRNFKVDTGYNISLDASNRIIVDESQSFNFDDIVANYGIEVGDGDPNTPSFGHTVLVSDSNAFGEATLNVVDNSGQEVTIATFDN